jgi:RHS repeat-associated protein
VVAENLSNNQQSERTVTTTTLFVWDGDVLTQELSCDDTITYLYEPDSFVPMARVATRGGYGSGVNGAGAFAPVTTLGSNKHVSDDSSPAVDAKDVRRTYLRDIKQWMLTCPTHEGERARLESADLYAEQAHQAAWRQCQADADASARSDRIDYYNCDHLGTPKELVDENSRLIWSARTRVWGSAFAGNSIMVAGAVGDNIMQPIRFQGQYEDTETGLYYNRYRYYDSENCRYLTQDPLGLLGGLNLYAYGPNPTVSTDPLGLAKTCSTHPTCDPCSGANPTAEAMAQQGTALDPSNIYTGQDSYTNMVIKKGTIFYSLSPGGAPGFAVTNHTVRKARGSAKEYHALTQVKSDNFADPAHKMRTKIRIYRVNEDICVAKGTALANPQFGKGGARQYYIQKTDRLHLAAYGERLI